MLFDVFYTKCIFCHPDHQLAGPEEGGDVFSNTKVIISAGIP